MSRPEGNYPTGKEILPKPTHYLAIGSVIYVLKLDGTWWARCILSGDPEVTPPLPVAMIGKRTTSGHSEPNTQAFVAVDDFIVWYTQHDSHASRPAGTEILAYPTGLSKIRKGRGK